LIRVEFLSADLCLTRWRRKRASSRSSRIRGSGSQIAGTRSRRLKTASTRESILSVLQASGARPFTLLRVGDLDVPAFPLERVMHEAGTGHRLDHTANRLPIGLVDPPGKAPQPIRVRRRGELVDVFSRLGEQTDVDPLSAEIQPGVQH
jgi:hypothetical protein